MRLKHLLLTGSIALMTQGCKFDVIDTGSVDNLVLGQNAINSELNKMKESISDIAAVQAQSQLTRTQQLSKDVATSGRLASIVTNYMNAKTLSVLSAEQLDLMSAISSSLKDDVYRNVFYTSLNAQGFAFENITLPNGNGYLHQGTWVLNTEEGSFFNAGYPSNSIELLPYESIRKPECTQGQPLAMHGLLIRKGSNSSEKIKYYLKDTGASWMVDFPDELSNELISTYRVLVKVACNKPANPLTAQ